jgi:hypothetical protein
VTSQSPHYLYKRGTKAPQTGPKTNLKNHVCELAKVVTFAKFVTKVQLPNLYLRNLQSVTVNCILHSTYHRTWETGLEEVTRVSASNPFFNVQNLAGLFCMIQLPGLGEVVDMAPRKILFVCANRRASRPVLQALGRAGFLLQVVSGLSQISSVCRCIRCHRDHEITVWVYLDQPP